MNGFGNTYDYFKRSTASPSGGYGQTEIPQWKPVNVPSVGNYFGSEFSAQPTGLNDPNYYNNVYAKQLAMRQAPALFQSDLQARQAAQQHNFDMAKLAFQAQLQNAQLGRDELEAGRSRDHALTMQARNFENDDYSAARQQFMRYGLGGYF